MLRCGCGVWLQEDAVLMCRNAMQYNADSSDVFLKARALLGQLPTIAQQAAAAAAGPARERHLERERALRFDVL